MAYRSFRVGAGLTAALMATTLLTGPVAAQTARGAPLPPGAPSSIGSRAMPTGCIR